MAGSITAFAALEQSLTGGSARGRVVVSNNGTGAPVTISTITLTTGPVGVGAQVDGLQFGGGGGGANASVPTVNLTVNSGSQQSFPFGVALPANVNGNASNVQVAGVVTLSDGTVVAITPAQLTTYVPATATAGSGLPPAPVFMQSPGAALFASNNNSSLDTFLSDD